MKLYMFRTVPLSIIRSSLLYTQQWYMSYNYADSLRAGSGCPLSCVQWKTPDDGQRNCRDRVEFHSKNKYEKLLHLVCFIIGIFSLYTQQWYMSYSSVDRLRAGSGYPSCLQTCMTYTNVVCTVKNSWWWIKDKGPASGHLDKGFS
jgi:hypothetical protein